MQVNGQNAHSFFVKWKLPIDLEIAANINFLSTNRVNINLLKCGEKPPHGFQFCESRRAYAGHGNVANPLKTFIFEHMYSLREQV